MFPTNYHGYDFQQMFENFYKMLLGEAHWKVMEQVIAFLVQCPGKKMRWAPIIVSDEGGGKGLLGEAVGRILGQLNVATNVGYKDVITTHSTIIRDKILVILNEVNSLDIFSLIAFMKLLKSS